MGGGGRFRRTFGGKGSFTGHRFIICVLEGRRRGRFHVNLSIDGGVNGTIVEGRVGECVHRTFLRLRRRVGPRCSLVIVTEGPITRVSFRRIGGDLVRMLGISQILGGPELKGAGGRWSLSVFVLGRFVLGSIGVECV